MCIRDRYKKKRESFTANSYLPRHRYSFDPVKTTHLLGLTASKTLWAPLSLNCIIKRMLRQELFECVKIVEFNVNSRVFHVVYQETRFLNRDACFLNQEGRRQFLISFVSERDWNRKICHAPWRIPPILAYFPVSRGGGRNRRTCQKNHSINTTRS